jgi:hypothetical protein
MPDLRPRHLAPAAAAAFGLGAALALAQEQPPGTTPRPAPTPTSAPGHVAPRATPAPDVYHLRNGDRITGRTIAQTRRSFAVQTPFGRLTLPRVRVARVVHADGSEEVLHPVDAAGAAAAALPTPAPIPAVGTARLVLAISGMTFWQAWDLREAERDPTLRLELRLDEEAVVVYADEHPDPDQIKGAVVNAFSFAEGLTISPAPSVRVHPPDVRPGRIVLKLDLAALSPAPKRLRLAYQINTGTAEKPAWKDAVSAATAVTIAESQPALVEVRQERGRMEFAGLFRRRMRHVDTFELDLTATTGADSP